MRGETGAPGAPDDGIVAAGVDRMAHQLKNPLQAIAVNLEVLRMKATRAAEADEREELERLAGVVNGSVRTLDRRIDLLVSLARRADDQPFRRVGLGAFVRDTADAFRLGDRENGRGVELDLPDADGEDPQARVRPGWLAAFLIRAVAVTPAPGGPTVLRVRPDGRGARLSLSAAGDPDAPAEGAEAGERLASYARRAGGELAREGDALVLRFPEP